MEVEVNILIVDDEPMILEYMKIHIKGFFSFCENVFVASSGVDAIEIVEKNDIDLIFCDYNMPNGTGGDVYKYLLETKMNIKFVHCSSDYAQDHDEFDNDNLLYDEIIKPNISDGIDRVFNRILL